MPQVSNIKLDNLIEAWSKIGKNLEGLVAFVRSSPERLSPDAPDLLVSREIFPYL